MPDPNVADDPLRDSLRRLFGHDDFRAGQREIVEAAMAGVDTLAVLPTGGGKSITYQLPAMLLDGATLILSPLIALMKDQAENLPPLVAERAALINSSLDSSEVGRRIAHIRNGRTKLIYAAPERLRQPPFLHALSQAGVSLVVVDEAHCISQWGHDFRPDYRAVGRAVEALAPRSVLAVTATAPPDVQRDIADQLGRTMKVLVRPTWRENLFLVSHKVAGEDDKLFTTLALCRQQDGAGLVYCSSREKCEQISRMLKRQGIAAGFYHAGLPPEERAAAQDRFMSGETRVMAATVAFGMGVDKSDIRFMVHYHPSRTLENYYQEAGRAGRDGKPSLCVLLHSGSDAAGTTRRLNEDALSVEGVRSLYQAIRTTLGRARSGAIAFNELSAAVGGDDSLVRSALPILEETGLIKRYADLPRSVRIEPSFDGMDSGETAPDPEWPRFADAIGGGGSFEPAMLSEQVGEPIWALEESLLRLQSAGHLTYRPAPRDPCFELLPPPDDTKARLSELLKHRAEGAAYRASAMRDYGRVAACRHRQIAAYFGDAWPRRSCGACDICAPREHKIPTASAAPARSADTMDPPLAALTLVADLTRGYNPFFLGRAGLVRSLRGTPDAPIRQNRSAAFGACASRKKAELERMVDALVDEGLLDRDETDEYRPLRLTGRGEDALSNGGAVDIDWRRSPAPASDSNGRGNGGAPGASSRTVSSRSSTNGDGEMESAQAVDPGLLSALKVWRKEQADAAMAPAFTIFADRTLLEIAARKPANEFDLLAISGIGPAKSAKFGDAVLEIVRRAGE